jgi:hypothetical protein
MGDVSSTRRCLPLRGNTFRRWCPCTALSPVLSRGTAHPSQCGSTRGPPLGAAALPATFYHYLCPDVTLAETARSGSPRIHVRPHLSEQAAVELAYLSAQVRAVRLSATPVRRLIALGPSEDFCTSDGYRALHAYGCIVPHQDMNWENCAPPKVRVFFWILRLGKTRTHTHLFRLGCVSSPHCPFCLGQLKDL